MILEEIKEAVEAGKKVCWKHTGYKVIKDMMDQWMIHCIYNDSYIGLTHNDGVTLNGAPKDFFIPEELQSCY